MDFEPWFNARWDEVHRSGFHEGGHLEYARHINPQVAFTVHVDGAGGGRTVLNLTGFMPAHRYAVAVAGCLAEAKGIGGHESIDPNAPDHKVAQQIHDKFVPRDCAWQVDVMVGGNSVPSVCNGIDFEFLDGAAPELAMLEAAVAEVTRFFNNNDNWLRVKRTAWWLAIGNRP